MTVRRCGHCGQECWMSEAGFASWNGVPVCNPEPGSGRMECYELIKQFHHEMDCQECKIMLRGGGPVAVEDHRHV